MLSGRFGATRCARGFVHRLGIPRGLAPSTVKEYTGARHRPPSRNRLEPGTVHHAGLGPLTSARARDDWTIPGARMRSDSSTPRPWDADYDSRPTIVALDVAFVRSPALADNDSRPTIVALDVAFGFSPALADDASRRAVSGTSFEFRDFTGTWPPVAPTERGCGGKRRRRTWGYGQA